MFVYLIYYYYYYYYYYILFLFLFYFILKAYFRVKIYEAHIPVNTLKPHHLKYLPTYTLHEIDELEQKLKNLRSQVEHLCNTKEELEKQEIALTEERWVYEKFNTLLSNVKYFNKNCNP